MRSKNRISRKMMAVLAAVLIAAMLLTGCGGGGGGSAASSVAPAPTPGPTPNPDPVPEPTPTPTPEPGEMIAMPDEKTGWIWYIRVTGSNTATLVCTGYEGTGEPSGSLMLPENWENIPLRKSEAMFLDWVHTTAQLLKKSSSRQV